jgi:hypothetical protein
VLSPQRQTLIEALIRIEEALSHIYLFFSNIFPQDAAFWHSLHLEEEKHALLIRTHGDYILESPELIVFFARNNPDLLLSLAIQFEDHLPQLDRSYPSREEALALALKLEGSAGEAHYQALMRSTRCNGWAGSIKTMPAAYWPMAANRA